MDVDIIMDVDLVWEFSHLEGAKFVVHISERSSEDRGGDIAVTLFEDFDLGVL